MKDQLAIDQASTEEPTKGKRRKSPAHLAAIAKLVTRRGGRDAVGGDEEPMAAERERGGGPVAGGGRDRERETEFEHERQATMRKLTTGGSKWPSEEARHLGLRFFFFEK